MTTKKPLDPFKAAALFIGKKDVRNYLNFIYSDGEALTASDGSALIVIKHKAEPGYYDKQGQKIGLEARYPRFEKVFNGCTKAEPVELATGTPEQLSRDKVIKFNFNGGEPTYYDAKYIKYMKKIGVTAVYIVADFEQRLIKLYYEKDNFKGVIMSRFVNPQPPESTHNDNPIHRPLNPNSQRPHPSGQNRPTLAEYRPGPSFFNN